MFVHLLQMQWVWLLTFLDGKTPETTGTYDNGKIDVKAKQTNVIVVEQENVKKELIDSEYYEDSEFTGYKT